MNAAAQEAFIRTHWRNGRGDIHAWFAAMAQAGCLDVDWPVAAGGQAWPRPRLYEFVSRLARARCPLMPDAMTSIAPIVIRAGDRRQQNTLLPLIRQTPLAWSVAGDTEYRLDNELGDLVIKTPCAPGERLGEPGCADRLLATCCSPAWTLLEFKIGMRHIDALRRRQEASSDELVMMDVEEAALDALFLADTESADRQLALLVSRARLPLFSRLFDLLGHYALLQPDERLTHNEPLPFRRERAHLNALRFRYARDETSQQELLYEMCADFQDEASA